MEENARFVLLLDLYAPLLTEKQRRALSLRLEEDLSLSEIAQMEQVSRQAVSDLIGKAEDALLAYEEKLQLLKKELQCRKELEVLLQALEKDRKDEALSLVRSLLDAERE